MPEVAEDGSPNTMSLDQLLAGTDLHSRSAILAALLREGFELEDGPLPCLHHSREVLAALDAQAYALRDAAWEPVLRVLQVAQRIGMIVDVCLRRSALLNAPASPASGVEPNPTAAWRPV